MSYASNAEIAGPPIEANLLELFQHLGIERAHLAVGGPPPLTDWLGLATRSPERIASLTLMSPTFLDPAPLAAMASRLLAVTGDKGRTAQGSIKLLADLPTISLHTLRDYEWFPWSDLAVDRGMEIGAAILDFLERHAIPPIALPEAEGEVAGISYSIRGAGPPLVLLPLSLAPSQWDPLIAMLSERCCTISLGGPQLGVVGILEARGRSDYATLVRSMLDLVRTKPGDVVLEVGGGSGFIVREIARRTAGANRIIDIDINPYLLREAASLAAKAGFADWISFEQGSAEAIPLADSSVDIALSFTVLEEGDADRMLAELVRVTRPGGRIAAIVRATDMPSWTNAPLSAAIRTKIDGPGLVNGGMSPVGCADATLYRRFQVNGLNELICFPQLVSFHPTEFSRITNIKLRMLAALTEEEREEWRSAVAQAEANGTFFIASSHHCAVGTKPG